jgi:hypothetical protein
MGRNLVESDAHPVLDGSRPRPIALPGMCRGGDQRYDCQQDESPHAPILGPI